MLHVAGGPGIQGQSVLTLQDANTVVLTLKSRKNRPAGSILKRCCTCEGAEAHCMCPVHSLWHNFFAMLAPGEQPSAHIGPSSAITALRKTLLQLAVPDSDRYGTHDFRRGHAKDMQKSHQPLAVICGKGDWSVSSKGTGALPYLDRCELEQDIALEIAIESEDEQWID